MPLGNDPGTKAASLILPLRTPAEVRRDLHVGIEAAGDDDEIARDGLSRAIDWKNARALDARPAKRIGNDALVENANAEFLGTRFDGWRQCRARIDERCDRDARGSEIVDRRGALVVV